jgi:hypothetical protein
MPRKSNAEEDIEEGTTHVGYVTEKPKEKAVKLADEAKDVAETLFSRAKKFANERPAAALGLGILALWIGKRILR